MCVSEETEGSTAGLRFRYPVGGSPPPFMFSSKSVVVSRRHSLFARPLLGRGTLFPTVLSLLGFQPGCRQQVRPLFDGSMYLSAHTPPCAIRLLSQKFVPRKKKVSVRVNIFIDSHIGCVL